MKTSDLYTNVTNEVIRQLNEGVPPWTRPWRDSKAPGIGMLPSNLVTGRFYSGGNILLLWLYGAMRGYPHMQYCTYKQVSDIGAKVRKGERATFVLFTKRIVKRDEDSGEDKPTTVVKNYGVFNVDQLEDVPESYLQPQVLDDTRPVNARAGEFVQRTCISVHHGAHRAAYYPARDEILMPIRIAFVNEDAYWATLAHELVHASGHKDRLNRRFGKRFADHAYAFEELVAELGSAFLCARLGIEPGFRSASYIDGWLQVMTGDHRAILTAASYAGHAADWLWQKAYGNDDQPVAE